jgi:serine/threonine protein kinase
MGEYEPIEVLGVGTTCDVFLARKKTDSMDAFVAVKRIKKFSIFPNQIESVLIERDILVNSLAVKNIVNLVKCSQTGVAVSFVLEFCDGGDLTSHLQKSYRFSENQVKYIGASLFHALSHLQLNLKYLHCDVKPENLLFTSRGIVKLTDFGLARKLPSSPAQRYYEVIGTPAYMAPEMVAGNIGYDGSIDLWAMGVVLFACLFGGSPFNAPTNEMTMEKVLNFREQFRMPPTGVLSFACESILEGLIEVKKERLRLDQLKFHAFFDGLNDLRGLERVDPPFKPDAYILQEARTISDWNSEGSGVKYANLHGFSFIAESKPSEDILVNTGINQLADAGEGSIDLEEEEKDVFEEPEMRFNFQDFSGPRSFSLYKPVNMPRLFSLPKCISNTFMKSSPFTDKHVPGENENSHPNVLKPPRLFSMRNFSFNSKT